MIGPTVIPETRIEKYRAARIGYATAPREGEIRDGCPIGTAGRAISTRGSRIDIPIPSAVVAHQVVERVSGVRAPCPRDRNFGPMGKVGWTIRGAAGVIRKCSIPNAVVPHEIVDPIASA